MQDAKTGGSRWVPDIREDEITEFQEQNGDETATYKAVNVHPIISRVLDKLAFFRTHVSAVWYNKLANKTVKDKLDEIDTSISSLNSNIDELDSGKAKYINITQNAVSANPIQTLKNNWDNIPDGYYLARVACGSEFFALIQHINNGLHGSARLFSYTGMDTMIKVNNGEWT